MNRALTNRMQGLLNKSLTAILGCSQRMMSVGLWAEMGLDPICALAAARRARAFGKCGLLRTWVRELVTQPLRSRNWTWSNGIPRWIKRFTLIHAAPEQIAGPRHGDAWRNLPPPGNKENYSRMYLPQGKGATPTGRSRDGRGRKVVLARRLPPLSPHQDGGGGAAN